MISVLIVDDDASTVELIREKVNWEGLSIANVKIAFNVYGAKEILQTEKIDIIISDIEMPQETGLDLLEWVRKTGIECEFILFTSHENFTYATTAINFEAAAYITKPFDLHTMELKLQETIMRLEQKRKLKETSQSGILMKKNQRILKTEFWKSLLDGELLGSDVIEREIKKRDLDVSAKSKYCFVYTKLSNTEKDINRYGQDVFEFILKGLHSEVLTGIIENEYVNKFLDDQLSYITICYVENHGNLKEKCDELIEALKKYFDTTFTLCISNPHYLAEMPDKRKKIKEMFRNNLDYYGKIFFEFEIEKSAHDKESNILDIEKLVTLIKQKDKTKILNYIKDIFTELSSFKNLSFHSLSIIKQDIKQVVYGDLTRNGIQATKIFNDDISMTMDDSAINSTIDMMRWINYFLEKTFAYEEEISKTDTVIDKVNKYIHDNYREDIGRNEIAEEFFLTPDYLGKLYKKETGKNISSYINECRIEKATELLGTGKFNVSETAELVGFSNFSYFSTLFKKFTGVSPNRYKGS